MNFDAYAHRAVELVNAPMDGLDDLKSLLRDGKLKVLNGTTTAEEVVKVAQVEGIVTV